MEAQETNRRMTTTRYIPPSTIATRERELLRSILWSPTDKWGPAVSTAIAYIPEFSECGDGASAIATAILEVIVKGRRPTEAAVKDRLDKSMWHYLETLLNSVGMGHPLPLSVQESEALDMIAYYKGRQAWKLVAKAEQSMRKNFAEAVTVARQLRKELEHL